MVILTNRFDSLVFISQEADDMKKESFISRKKEGIFPWIKDWSDNQDKHRYTKNVKNLSWDEWFWLHPSAYKLIFYGGPIISLLLFGSITFFFWFRTIGMISLLFTLYFLFYLIKQIRGRKLVKDINFYDIYMREDKYGH